MTVNTSDNVIVYNGNGSTTLWTFPFPIVEPQFVHVAITNAANVQTVISPSLFQVTMNDPIDPNPTSLGGTVKYPLTGSPLAAGDKITIARVLPVVQDTSIGNQSIIYPAIVEQALDYLTLLIQGGTTNLDRSFKVPFGDPFPADVPTVDLRKNQQAFFDALGNLTAGAFTGPGVIVSAAMQPVVAAATIALAQQLLGTQAMIDASLATVFTTGDLKPTHKTVADAGWIIWSDGTIGNTGSGATIRQNIDTLALFTLYYNNYTDANCPLTTSSGTATSRAAQGTASTAFNSPSLCRMTLPKGAGRSLGIAGQGSGLTNRPLGSTVGIETVTPTIATMANHLHQSTSSLGGFPFLGDASALGLGYLGNNDFSGPNNIVDMAIATEGGGQPFSIMQPTTYVNIMVKL